MDCNLTIIDHLINCRYSPGRENLGTPVGIVLRDMTLPLGQYLLTPTTKVERSYPLSYPKSVHFAVSGDGSTYRLVDVNDTAWGLDRYLNTNVPGIPVTTDPSTPWVFVGIDNEDGGPCTVSTGQLDSLVSLICCLCRDFGIAPSESGLS